MARYRAGGAKLNERIKTDAATDVELARKGDVEAFERLYHVHVARIHGLSRRFVGAAEAEDATQEIFIRAWRRLETFRGDAAFGTWISRLARNVLLDRRKRHAVEEHFATNETVDEGIVLPPSISSRDCEEALLRLPDGARQTLVLHDIEGHTHQEIAELLGIRAGTSKSQLHRARALLRNLLAGNESAVKP